MGWNEFETFFAVHLELELNIKLDKIERDNQLIAGTKYSDWFVMANLLNHLLKYKRRIFSFMPLHTIESVTWKFH